MSFINNEILNQDSNMDLNQSFQNEALFLRAKLIQNHKKLLLQLEKSKKLQQEIDALQLKNMEISKQNQSLNLQIKTNLKQIALLKAQKISQQNEEQKKQFKLNKNELLRIDLQSMRNKTLQLMMQKSQLQQKLQQSMQQQQKVMYDKNKDETIKKLKIEYQQLKYQIQDINKKNYENRNIVCNLKEILNHKKIQLESKQILINQKEVIIKKQQEQNQQLLKNINLLEKEVFQVEDLKNKLCEKSDNYSNLREKLMYIENKSKEDNKTYTDKVQKLTYQINNLNLMYRQKQKEISKIKQRKPLQDTLKQQQNMDNIKQFIDKLENDQNNKKYYRSKDRINKQIPLKSYKDEKQQYLSLISQVSEIQNHLLQGNLQKKKILAELQKIECTKIKTKEMINKRKKLQVELQNQEVKIGHLKLSLKKMKIM